MNIIQNTPRDGRRKKRDFRSLPPAGGGWEGGTARTVFPASFLNHLGFPPPRLPPLGGGQHPRTTRL